jgi:hypothetical protein
MSSSKQTTNSSSQVTLALHPNFPAHSLRKTSGVPQPVEAVEKLKKKCCIWFSFTLDYQYTEKQLQRTRWHDIKTTVTSRES